MHTTALLCLLSGRQTMLASKMSRIVVDDDRDSFCSSSSEDKDFLTKSRKGKLTHTIA